jgi:two-component system sensor histidine kinase PilS (NtrC family)
MTLRVMVATVMLGVTILIQLREGAAFLSTPMRGLYLFVGLAYLLTVAYGLALPQVRDHGRFATVQLAADLLLLSGVVLITGGVASPFLVVYFLIIIGAGILFYRRGSLVAATASAVLYGAAVAAPLAPRVAALVDPEGAYRALSGAAVGYRHLLAVFGFFLVAFLASHLAESLRSVGAALSVASASLAELERRSEHILQNIASGLVTTDLGRRILYCNRAAERLAQISAEEVLGLPFDAVFRLRGGFDPWVSPELLEGSPVRVEGGIAGRGDEPLLGMTFSPLRGERQEVSGVICAFQDLTQIRRMEEQVRRSDRLAAVGELAAGMAHEIRNPLASLSGSIQLLSEGLRLEGDERELMTIVTREVGRLNALITDFLLYASPRPPQLRAVELPDLVGETVTLLRQARGDAWRIAVEREGEGPVRVEVDPQLMRQVFWNLSLNALEAMPAGGDLVIRLSRVPAGVAVTFADTGTGIPAAEMPKIFTPFHSTKEGGTGLGLAVVFRIVEAHGGQIEVESRPGRGTVVRVLLPAVHAAAPALAPAPATATATALGGAA